MSAGYGTIQGATFVACHLEPKASDFGAGPEGRTVAENEAELVSRRISEQCDHFHHDAGDAGCVNTSCMCWCHE